MRSWAALASVAACLLLGFLLFKAGQPTHSGIAPGEVLDSGQPEAPADLPSLGRRHSGAPIEAISEKPVEKPVTEARLLVAAGPRSSLRGSVFDGEGQPLGRQYLALSGLLGLDHKASAMADDEGYYQCQSLVPGTYEVWTCSARGSECDTRLEDILIGEGPNHHDFSLVGTFVLEGTVVMEASSDGATGPEGPIQVELVLRRKHTGEEVGRGYTDNHALMVDPNEPPPWARPPGDDRMPDEEEILRKKAKAIPGGWFRFAGLSPDTYVLEIKCGQVTARNGQPLAEPEDLVVEREFDLLDGNATYSKEWTMAEFLAARKRPSR